MNVIIANKYKSMLENVEFDIIKEMNGEFAVEEIISTFKNFFFQRMILDITAIKDYNDIKTLQKLSMSLNMDKVILLLDTSQESLSEEYQSNLISIGIYNFTRNLDGVLYLYNNPNSYRDVAHIHQLSDSQVYGEEGDLSSDKVTLGPKIIGVKNITQNSGATTLVYVMKQQLRVNYKVVGIEVNKRDFVFFKDKELISIADRDLENLINKYRKYDVILIDINDSETAEGFCRDVVYLIEPSIIKLNKLMFVNGSKLKNLKGKIVILNQSLLSSKDVLDFEYESRLKIFFNMPPLDERQTEVPVLNNFLVRLGFERQRTSDKEKKRILGLFNF